MPFLPNLIASAFSDLLLKATNWRNWPCFKTRPATIDNDIHKSIKCFRILWWPYKVSTVIQFSDLNRFLSATNRLGSKWYQRSSYMFLSDSILLSLNPTLVFSCTYPHSVHMSRFSENLLLCYLKTELYFSFRELCLIPNVNVSSLIVRSE